VSRLRPWPEEATAEAIYYWVLLFGEPGS